MGFHTVGTAKGEEILLGNLGSDSSILSVRCDGEGKDENKRPKKLVADVLLQFENLLDLRDALDLRILEVRDVKRMDETTLDPRKDEKELKRLRALLARCDLSERR